MQRIDGNLEKIRQRGVRERGAIESEARPKCRGKFLLEDTKLENLQGGGKLNPLTSRKNSTVKSVKLFFTFVPGRRPRHREGRPSAARVSRSETRQIEDVSVTSSLIYAPPRGRRQNNMYFLKWSERILFLIVRGKMTIFEYEDVHGCILCCFI